mmetsp:Transcript_4761/g.5546  ORF Transcript_4761/g.5546 Transcript_4761/m.5546 type:complete len:118 (+) Transcript_4761:966-1319(+)
MDSEHGHCLQLIHGLAEHRSKSALQAVYDEFQTHFEHEEAMLTEAGFGGAGGKFSALESHKREHERILTLLQGYLKTLKEDSSVASEFVQRVVDEFVEHAEEYDSKYTSHMLSIAAH